LREPPDDCPHLRTTRDLAPGQVITIEPGLYFISSLLDPLRTGAGREGLDWERIDLLMPFGGIRIEDDVLVTEQGRENLTRHFVSGHVSGPVPGHAPGHELGGASPELGNSG
jgi:Xaa-Pro dipeptidase